MINASSLKQHFFREDCPTESQALKIFNQATQVLSAELNLVDFATLVTSAFPLVVFRLYLL